MSLEDWQIALRREFGREQKFKIENIGAEPFFSEFHVANPATGGVYRVAIRGELPYVNYCSCPDYAVNTLGTCKHIEFALAALRRRPGAKAAFARGWRPEYSEVYLRYGAKREAVFGAGIGCPPKLLAVAAKYFDSSGVLRQESQLRFDAFLKEAEGVAKEGHELRCYEDALGFIAEIRDGHRRRQTIDKAFPDGAGSAAFDKLLKVPLYPYQRAGALFAARAGRSLIADDMGLGKTIQAIAAAEILARTAGIERALIICPTSLKHQWREEIAKFTARTVQVAEGFTAAREACYAADSFFKIVNYDVIHRDRDLIRQWSPDLIVLDEAQRIKNWKTRTAQSVKRLSSQHAIVLTGTPLENRLEELHSIVEFVDRFRLGPTFRFLAEHQRLDEGGRVVGYRNLSGINETLKPIMIRRTKAEVLRDLPERLDKTFLTPMTPQQMEFHKENGESVAKIVAKWRRMRFLSDADQRRLRIALQNMRMACNSTFLLDRKTDHGVKADEAATLLSEVFESNGTKAVVFSQWLRTHELLGRRFEARGWPFVLFHGGVPGPKRRELVQRFREDPDCRLFLSTDAGGVGLNLQHASVVINMDQPWNPAVLEQRIGRVHRLGQRRPVRVINFVAQGTIEHGMLSLLAFKKAVFAGALDGGADEVFLGGSRLTKFMESVEQATGGIPPAMPVQDAPVPGAEGEGVEETPRAGATNGKETAERPALLGAGAPDAGWSAAAQAGLDFLAKLGQAISAGKREPRQDGGLDSDPAATGLGSLIGRDERTGQSYLKIPVPRPEALQKITELLGALAGLGK